MTITNKRYMLKFIKSLVLVCVVGLLVGTAYAAGGEEGLIAVMSIATFFAFVILVVRLIPPLFWTIFFAVGFAILVFGH